MITMLLDFVASQSRWLRAKFCILLLFYCSLSSHVLADSSNLKDCYVEINGMRVIDGPCQVNRAPTPNIGNTYDLQFITSNGHGGVVWFYNLRVTDFSTTASWNGAAGEQKDLISLGNTFRAPDSDPSLPVKCRSNLQTEVCLWDQNERPESMKHSYKPFMPVNYVFDWSSYIPHYNVNINCKQISANQDRLRLCVQNEQESYNLIKNAWSHFDDTTKANCAHVANVKPWENYQYMAKCLSDQMEDEEREKPVPKFQE